MKTEHFENRFENEDFNLKRRRFGLVHVDGQKGKCSKSLTSCMGMFVLFALISGELIVSHRIY
jgi:hypothetical protein